MSFLLPNQQYQRNKKREKIMILLHYCREHYILTDMEKRIKSGCTYVLSKTIVFISQLSVLVFLRQ